MPSETRMAPGLSVGWSTDYEGIYVVRLNRPERRNAMVPSMMDALADAIVRPEGAKAIVLAAEGPSFCVGADLKWLGEIDAAAEGVATLVAAHHAVVRVMHELPVPLIAAVNGPAAGGGMSLALAADYRVASERATFTAAYFRLGLPPDGGNSAFLTRMVGHARATEMLLTNRTVSAAEALSWGLVNEVVPHDRLLAHTCEIAVSLPVVPRETLLATRNLLDMAAGDSLTTHLQREGLAMRRAAHGPAFATALRAFLDRGSDGR